MHKRDNFLISELSDTQCQRNEHLHKRKFDTLLALQVDRIV